jgi:hypothetical protein
MTEVSMSTTRKKAKPAKSSNVIRLVTDNKNPRKFEVPPELLVPWAPQDVPWHIHVATWALRWRSREPNIYALLTPWEERFLADMTIWNGAPTDRQVQALERIMDKIERQLAVMNPNPAA